MIGRGRRARVGVISVFAVLLMLGTTGPAPPARAGTSGPSRPYIPPVEAPVTDPFRAPANPYGPGNRGIEYATVPGTPVVAAADGVVVFAGPVAGSLYVTVLHPDGIRTSYSFLAGVDVQTGDVVAQGAVVGTAGAVFHVGARIGDTYIDPALLWGGLPHVMLVDLEGGAATAGPSMVAPSRSAIGLGYHAGPSSAHRHAE